MQNSIIKIHVNYEVPEGEVMATAEKYFLEAGFIVQPEDLKVEVRGRSPPESPFAIDWSFSDWLMSAEYYIKLQAP